MNWVKSPTPSTPSAATIQHDGSSSDCDEEDDQHRPLSPASAAESFFLPNTSKYNSRISASALASSLHNSTRSRASSTLRSIGTEDFASACDDLSEHGDEEAYLHSTSRHSSSNSTGGLFGRDILVFASPATSDTYSSHSNMSSYRSKKSKQPVIVNKTAPPALASPATEEDPHFDVGTNVYEAAKSVWTWGRGIPVAGAVLGLYEGAAAKVATTVVHKDLSTVDSEIKHHVSGLDKDLIDPAIAALLNIIFPAVEKGEEVLIPILKMIPGLGMIFPKLLTEEGENPETSTPSLEVN